MNNTIYGTVYHEIPDTGDVPLIADISSCFLSEPLDVTVRLRISPDTEALRDAVRAEIEDVFSREGAPDSVLYRSHISEAVSLTPGEQDHELLEPAEDVVVPAAYLPRLTQVIFEGEVESHA